MNIYIRLRQSNDINSIQSGNATITEIVIFFD